MAYLNMPEMFTDRATGSNCTKKLDIVKTGVYSEFMELFKFEKSVVAALCGFVTNVILIILLLIACSV